MKGPISKRPFSGVLLCIAGVIGLLGCGEEDPTDVGGSLLPGQAIRTVELIVDGATYLARDTSFTGYTRPSNAGYFVFANSFQGVFNANAIGHFDMPTAIAVVDTGGTLRTDSMPTLFAGRIVLLIDTLRSDGPAPARFRAHRLTEEFDVGSANWTYRVDTTGVQTPWSQPGALGGMPIDTASWVAGRDSVVIPVDSATIAAWADTMNAARGAVVIMETAGIRAVATDFVLRVDARSTLNPDTVVTTTIRPPERTFLFDPVLAAAGVEPLVGGNPAWRAYFEFNSGIDTLTVACPDAPVTCRIPLRDADITFAAMQLVPRVSPPGFLPSDSMQLVSRLLLVSDIAPLPRSPLGAAIGVTRGFVRRTRFLAPAGGDPIEIPVTEYVRALVADTSTAVPLTRWIAVHPGIEGIDIGVAAFDPMPRLRLVLTVASELQLR